MKLLKYATWLSIEKDFRLTKIMKKTSLHKKFPDLFSFLLFRIKQKSDLYEVFLGIRASDGKFIKS